VLANQDVRIPNFHAHQCCRAGIRAYPPRSKTFLRKTDAKKWAVQTGTEIRTGMYIRQSRAGKHTAKEMLEKYKDEKLGDKAGKGMADGQTQLRRVKYRDRAAGLQH
jgi:hypothetical protein